MRPVSVWRGTRMYVRLVRAAAVRELRHVTRRVLRVHLPAPATSQTRRLDGRYVFLNFILQKSITV